MSVRNTSSRDPFENYNQSSNTTTTTTTTSQPTQDFKEQAEYHQEIIDHYENILHTFGDTLQKETKLTKDSLMDVIKVAVPLLNNPDTEAVQFIATVQKDSDAVAKEKKFLARKGEGGKLELSRIKFSNFTAGGLGKIHYATSFSSELGSNVEKRAFKMAKIADDFATLTDDPRLREEYAEIARKDIDQEVAMQRFLHSKPNCPDSIHISYALVPITPVSDKATLQAGSLSRLYDDNLLNSQEEISKKLERGRDMLSAIAFMHKQDIIHKDLKLDNFLAKGDKTVLIDLGGARSVENSNLIPNFIQGGQLHFDSATPGYVSLNLLEKAEEKLLDVKLNRLKKGSKSLIQKKEEGARKALKRNDVFAMGAVLFSLFAGVLPYKLGKDGYPDENSISLEGRAFLVEKGVDEDIANLLYKMLDCSRDITMEEVETNYNNILRDIVYDQGIELYESLTGGEPFVYGPNGEPDYDQLFIDDKELRRRKIPEEVITLLHEMLDMSVNITSEEAMKRYEEVRQQQRNR